jgi:putative photosynthetic complex assembly protein 2
MAEHGLPFLFAVVVWWFSTGAILWLCTRPASTFGWSMAGATLIAALALVGSVPAAWGADPASAYLAFACAIALWGWLEMCFLMGLVTGPRTTPCPDDARGWRRFRMAIETLIYNEISIAAVAVVLVAVTWGAPNQAGTLAFLILMAMRISAKLNIFLGIPNLSHELMPDRLAYLKSYFRKRPFNALFPFSILLSTILAFGLGQSALGAETGGVEATGLVLAFTLLVLAILEHCFMIMPLRDAALWRWAMPAASAKTPDEAAS